MYSGSLEFRAELVDWILKNSLEAGCSTNAIQIGFYIFERFLQTNHHVREDQMQTYLVAAMHLSIKFTGKIGFVKNFRQNVPL